MPAKEKTAKEEMPEPVVIRNEPEKGLVTWSAPARPFKRRDREFYVTIIAIAAIFGLVLFLVEGWLPVVLIISLVFLFYVMSTVEPEIIEYKITTKGVRVAGRRNDWPGMTRFWFMRRYNSELLIIETYYFPGRIELVLLPDLKEKIKKVMSTYLLFEEAPASSLDKLANWFSKKFLKS
ncbi:hypothetical protein HY008_00465 [Candidatus Woesebacteria bacterium]|nr:hypothetical protein [Candidatus Woesebacteria bacterium]